MYDNFGTGTTLLSFIHLLVGAFQGCTTVLKLYFPYTYDILKIIFPK